MGHSPKPETRTLSLLFMDIAGWSKLTPVDTMSYLEKGLPRLADIVRQSGATHQNTWGDALVATFQSARSAAECALNIRDFFRRTAASEGLPSGLRPRTSLHVGEVIVAHNPVLDREDIFGEAVHLAARLEPVTAQGEVYSTRAFADALKAISGLGPVADPLGQVTLPKGFGTIEIFSVRGPGEPPPLARSETNKPAERGVAPISPAPAPKPAVSAVVTTDSWSVDLDLERWSLTDLAHFYFVCRNEPFEGNVLATSSAIGLVPTKTVKQSPDWIFEKITPRLLEKFDADDLKLSKSRNILEFPTGRLEKSGSGESFEMTVEFYHRSVDEAFLHAINDVKAVSDIVVHVTGMDLASLVTRCQVQEWKIDAFLPGVSLSLNARSKKGSKDLSVEVTKTQDGLRLLLVTKDFTKPLRVADILAAVSRVLGQKPARAAAS